MHTRNHHPRATFEGLVNRAVLAAGFASFFQNHSQGAPKFFTRASSPARPSRLKRAAVAGVCAFAILAGAKRCAADDLDRLIDAVHQVETSGRLGAIKGDGGRALGPLQIHRAYWLDSRVPGRYEDCARLDYSRRVFRAYMARYAPRVRDFETLARIHNGGPKGHKKPATKPYWRKVERNLKP